MPLTFTLHTPNGDFTVFGLVAVGCKATVADVIVFDETSASFLACDVLYTACLYLQPHFSLLWLHLLTRLSCTL